MLYNETAGRYKRAGEPIIRPELAKYLERVAQNPEGLETGELQEDVAADLADLGSIITLKDLVDYEPLWRTPLEMPLRIRGHREADFILRSAPPPSCAVLLGLALNTMAGGYATRALCLLLTTSSKLCVRNVELTKYNGKL